MQIRAGVTLTDPFFPPASPFEWKGQFTAAVQEAFRNYGDRIENLTTFGDIVSRPPAKGTATFFFAVDEGKLYFDGLTDLGVAQWHHLGSEPVVAAQSMVIALDAENHLASLTATGGLQDSGATAATFAAASHNHTESQITDLATYVKAAGTVGLSADWDAGSHKITAETLASDVATGTAPLTVASTTKVTNLQADLLDGYHAASFINKGVAAQISTVTEKATPVGNDLALIEDSESSNAKKSVKLSAIAALAGAGAAPQTLSPVNATGTASSLSYVTVIDVSSGPYLIHLIANTHASYTMYFKVTIDGTVVSTDELIAAGNALTGPGLAGNTTYAMTLSARSSFKLEVRKYGSNCTWRCVYQQIGIT